MRAPFAELPYATAKSLTTLGKIRSVPEDFRVDEVPAYPPAGQGTHLFIHFEKRNLTTREAVARLAKGLGVNPRDVGVAGQKDKHALTTQWASFERATPDTALRLSLPDIRVLAAVPHPHKLRTGHVRANRFALVLRLTNDLDSARAVLAELERCGVPNYYGEQRFGIGGRNVDRARAMLRGEAPVPRDRFEAKMLMSSLQSALFNEWLGERIADGLFERPIPGDLLRKEATGGIFINQDNDEATRRMREWEISATGPMFGATMRRPEALAEERERALFDRSGVTYEMLQRFTKLGEGTRRPARVRLSECRVERDGDALQLAFELPAGAYATTVLREVMKSEPA
jgi:tRNA pseudouridine13 synthase